VPVVVRHFAGGGELRAGDRHMQVVLLWLWGGEWNEWLTENACTVS
jgi:hypothetical protein